MSRASAAGGATARSGSSSQSKSAGKKQAKGYFQRSEQPLMSLVFLLPLVAAYELGTRYYSADITDIIAFNLLRDFFRLFGAYGRHLPALAVIGILLAWHIARRDRWSVSPKYLLGMAIESSALAVPLILVGFVMERYLPLMATDAQLPSRVVLSIGAGIYEELVFRLIAFTVLSLVLVDVLGIKRFWAYLLMVVMSSLAFSLYHYLGTETFQARTFAFRTAAGFYFGGVFAFRGFGISAGCHAAYDIIVSLLISLS